MTGQRLKSFAAVLRGGRPAVYQYVRVRAPPFYREVAPLTPTTRTAVAPVWGKNIP